MSPTLLLRWSVRNFLTRIGGIQAAKARGHSGREVHSSRRANCRRFSPGWFKWLSIMGSVPCDCSMQKISHPYPHLGLWWPWLLDITITSFWQTRKLRLRLRNLAKMVQPVNYGRDWIKSLTPSPGSCPVGRTILSQLKSPSGHRQGD
jgi:hypothetical protein